MPFKAREELKRADHLLYVSLKYTRTIDVIRSVVHRLMTAMDAGLDFYLENLVEKKKINDVPKSFTLKTKLFLKYCKEKSFAKEYVNFFDLLRRIDIADSLRKDEFRKNVTLIAVENGDVFDEVNIEKLKEYYKKTEEFINNLKEHM